VFGFLHKFERPDRNKYMVYNCENVFGFEEAYKKARADFFSKPSLCTDPDLMDDYNFPAGKVFVKAKGTEGSNQFDYHSITNYPSVLGANPDIVNKDPNNRDNYPLVAKDENGTKYIFQCHRHTPISASQIATPHASWNSTPGTSRLLRKSWVGLNWGLRM
jgi:hypothetical protein